MDFSIKNNRKNGNVSFTGIKSSYDAKTNKEELRFFAPPHSKDEKVELEVAFLRFMKDTNEFKNPTTFTNKIGNQELKFENDILTIPKNLIENRAHGFAYRYKITDEKGNVLKYALDQAKKIAIGSPENEEKANFINLGANYGITPKAGNLYHVFKDGYAIVDKSTLSKLKDTTASTFVRNHANKLGGSTKGITYILKNTHELDPYRYIMSTPDIGADKTSSHGYWPNNLYQCADMDAFKELNFELFKQGKGYIADGAFTSQSLQSPLLHHVLKWGESSPFYNMLKIDAKNGKLALGILPDTTVNNPSALDHVGVRLINKPGADGYNAKKPTYFQFYDDRLTSDELRDDTTKIIESYDKSPKDHYEISQNNDTIYPFYFEIDPNDSKHLGFFKNKNYVSYNDIIKQDARFFTFENFSIVDRAHASGAIFWAGNRDIVKLNLSNPRANDKNNEAGMQNARNYLYNVATFWTEGVQSNLILETAKLSTEELKKLAQNNDISPEEFKTIENSTETAQHPVLNDGKTARENIQEYIKNFPLQSIKTSPELSAIFAQPSFNSELLDNQTLDTIISLVEDAIETSVPNEYQNNEEYKKYVVKTFGNEIIRNIFISALAPDAINNNGTINESKLNDVTLKSLISATPFKVEQERKEVINKIKKSINNNGTNASINKMTDTLRNITLENFKLAESIVIQGKGGLNWRFDAAKDIGDLDSVGGDNSKNGSRTFSDIWDGENGVEAFWINFITNIRKYNPSAYIISEITNFWDFNKDNDRFDFDRKISQVNLDRYTAVCERKEKVETEKDGKLVEEEITIEAPYDRRPPRLKEARFLENSGSTTSSNYEACFNKLSFFVGVSPENKGEVNSSMAGNLGSLKSQIENFVTTNQPHIALLSHTFVDNHDKPRIMHCLPLDMSLFLSDNLAKESEEYKDLAKRLTGGRTDYASINPKAVAVGQIMEKQIDENKDLSDDEKKKLKHSLANLVNGKANDSAKSNAKRALAFGVLPYEVTIRDLFKGANVRLDKNGEVKQEVIDKFHSSMLKNSMNGMVALTEMMNAITGTPTLFNGTEFAQTGYETPSHNEYLGNRGITRHDLKDNPLYKKFYDKMQASASLYQQPEMSAIRSGSAISLKIQNNKEPKEFKLSFKKFPNGDDVNPGNIKYQAENIMAHGGLEAAQKFLNSGDINPDKLYEKFGIWHDNTNLNSFKNYLTTMITDESGREMSVLEAQIKVLEENSKIVSMWPIFKYDENGSKVISVITNNGLMGNKLSKDNDYKTEDCYVKSIKLVEENKVEKIVKKEIKKIENGKTVPETIKVVENKTIETTLPFELKEGETIKRKVYDENGKYINEQENNQDVLYTIKNDAIVRQDGKNIKLSDTVENFYVSKTKVVQNKK